MSLTIEYKRHIVKRTDNPANKATVPASNDHTDGTWKTTDLYVGELYMNTATKEMFLRTHDNNILRMYIEPQSVDDPDALASIPRPRAFQEVIVSSTGDKYVYIPTGVSLPYPGWYKQGSSFTHAGGNTFSKDFLENVPFDRLIMSASSGDLTKLSGASKSLASDTVDFGRNVAANTEIKIYVL